MENIIIRKVKNLNMGAALNHIQDVAEQILSEERWDSFLIATNVDASECEGMDGMLLNGEYFDWREFEFKKNEIIRAFLRYFTYEEIASIAKAL